MRIILLALFLIFVRVTITDGQIGMMLASETAAPDGPTCPADTVCSNLFLWLIAEDVDGDGNSGNNSGDYETWVDLSPAGNDVTQATSTNRPTYTASDLNGLATMDFDATDRMANTSMSALNNVDTYTVFVVQRTTAGSPVTMTTFCLNSSSYNPYLRAYISNFANGFYMNAKTSVGSNKFANNTDGMSDATAWNIGTYVLEADNDIYVMANDSIGTVVTGADAVPTTMSDMVIGAQTTTNTTSLTGRIAEVIAYKDVKSDAIRDQVRAYLQSKYGL